MLGLWAAGNDIVDAVVWRLVYMILWQLKQQVRSCDPAEERFDSHWDSEETSMALEDAVMVSGWLGGSTIVELPALAQHDYLRVS